MHVAVQMPCLNAKRCGRIPRLMLLKMFTINGPDTFSTCLRRLDLVMQSVYYHIPEDGDAEDHPNMYVVDSSGRLTVEEIANVRNVPPR